MIVEQFIENKNFKTRGEGFDPSTIGLEVRHSIHAELPAQKLAGGLQY